MLLATLPASAKECARLQVSDAGKDCPSASFDLSQCENAPSEAIPAKMSCGATTAKANADHEGWKLRGKLKRSGTGGAWGGKEWAVDSLSAELKEKKKPKSEEQAAKPKRQNSPFQAESQQAPAPVKSSKKEEASEPVSPSRGTASMKPALEFSAHFDAYYAWNFNRPTALGALSAATVSGAAAPAAKNQNRYYDVYNKQLGLSLAELTVKAQKQDFSLLLDLDFGTTADLTAGFSNGGAGVDEVSKHVGQAILTWKPSAAPGITLDVGKMATHIGLEMIKAKDNWNYSRSVLFGYGMPFWHLGARLGYDLIPEKLVASGYLYNGWSTLYDVNTAPTLGAQLKWMPTSRVTLVYAMITGPEAANDNHKRKTVHDLNGTWSVTDTLSLGFDALIGGDRAGSVNGVTTHTKWKGLEVLAKWQALPWYSLSPRWEVFRDQHGPLFSMGRPVTMQSYTLTNAFTVGEGMEVRFEARRDRSDQKSVV